MSRTNNNMPPEVAIAFTAVMLAATFAASIANTIGADIMVIVETLLLNIGALMITGFIIWAGYRLDTLDLNYLGITAMFSLCMIWPAWFPVLDNVVSNTHPIHYGRDAPWWNTGLFKGITEIVLIGITGFLIYRRFNSGWNRNW